jgi:YVTN family beta-propeller protein
MKSHVLSLLRALTAVSVCLSPGFLEASTTPNTPDARVITSMELVGRWQKSHTVTPTNQILTPEGLQVELPGMRPQALALSPDGRLLVTAGKTHELVVIDPVSGNILQRVPLPSEKAEPSGTVVSDHILEPDDDGQLSFTGLIFSPDGQRIYLSNVTGSIKVFAVGKDHQVTGLFSILLPPANAPRREAEIPSGLALSPDGKRIYVAMNLSNRLAELDTLTGDVLRIWNVGFAPYDVVLTGDKAYVSNWGGRRPGAESVTGPGGRGTLVRVDPLRHIASEGSVSIVDLEQNRVVGEILTGLHASGLVVSPDGRHIVIANAGSDTLSVVDTITDQIVETIWSKLTPAELFGASPNALAFEQTGQRLYVCNGTHNAVAVIRFRPGESELEGLIPVGWFPGAIVHDAGRDSLYVANIKGLGPGRPRKSDGRAEFNSRLYHGSVSLLKTPDHRELESFTEIVVRNYREPALQAARLPARTDQPPRPVPERVGEPSVFKHVVYIIKENRTYDQVFGDIPEGNGDPDLCIFPEKITPNQHRLVRDFVLLDNTYCSGILSADGHQWSDSAFATDYMEKSFAGFPRSYPDGMNDNGVDALAYAPSGFIWDNAMAHDLTVRSYGEFAITEKRWRDTGRTDKLDFTAHWTDFQAGNPDILISSRPAIESLRGHINTNTVGWDMDIPDVFRAAEFIRELKQFEQNGDLPHLTIICLPNDHTSGTKPGAPTPAAQVADNDLAFGQIIEAISHSRFWKDTCIFGIEDDPQNGWDHVSGYRTTAYLISPYTKRGATVSTQYNQTSLLRTIELILGLPPMNQMDASATPMFDCFTDVPDFRPFSALANNVPLDEMNPDPEKIADALLRRNAVASSRLPLEKIDQCPEDLMNRILWHAMKGSAAPYPQWAVTTIDDDDDQEILTNSGG